MWTVLYINTQFYLYFAFLMLLHYLFPVQTFAFYSLYTGNFSGSYLNNVYVFTCTVFASFSKR